MAVRRALSAWIDIKGTISVHVIQSSRVCGAMRTAAGSDLAVSGYLQWYMYAVLLSRGTTQVPVLLLLGSLCRHVFDEVL